MSLEVVLAVAVLMLICIGTYFVAGRLKLPYTVLLVIVGSILVPLSSFPFFAFLKSFQLTPELLFFVFLPVLIFESAYNMNMREMAENIRSISWLSVVSLDHLGLLRGPRAFLGAQAHWVSSAVHGNAHFWRAHLSDRSGSGARTVQGIWCAASALTYL